MKPLLMETLELATLQNPSEDLQRSVTFAAKQPQLTWLFTDSFIHKTLPETKLKL